MIARFRYYSSIIKKRAYRRWFNWRCRDIYRSPPLSCSPDGPLIVSQLYSPDVVMYLLAAKSFCRFIKPSGFVLVDDGLTKLDRIQLLHHLGNVEFIPSADVQVECCPRGGCWERLLTLSSFNGKQYVVQLDSDTLTLSDPVEVRECIASQQTFTLGTPSGRSIVSAAEATAFANLDPDDHVQSWLERSLDSLPDASGVKYVRGCAGFTGFAPGTLSRVRIEQFVAQLGALIGTKRFSQWGSEQVVSNLMAANAPTPLVLPVDTYPFWEPNLPVKNLRLVHFFGTFRFEQGMYLDKTRGIITELLRKPQATMA